MAAEQITVINQLANRLSNNTYSNEKIEALQELQNLSRSIPNIVGELALKKVLDFLQDQGNTEEYQESLDLISRLIKCRDKEISLTNANIILNEVSTIELLLDLLNHDDLTIGVMTSQILMELHLCNGSKLEAQIQQCPDAMNKLLQRLPDSSREEVRNQAIVLIQQLTSSNEEMKKTVAFNEGFEILFSIIQREGGSNEAGLVIQDCIHICKNILTNSETCQRLFFAMGGNEWVARLADFFDPTLLESMTRSNGGGAGFLLDEDVLEDDGSGKSSTKKQVEEVVSSDCWYEDTTRYSCAVLSLAALVNALSIHNTSHQKQITSSSSIVLASISHWIARRGPSELAFASLYLLYHLVEANADTGFILSNMTVKINPVIPRKNYPVDIEHPTLHFSWKPVPTDDRRFISLLALLAERYLYPYEVWSPTTTHSTTVYEDMISAMDAAIPTLTHTFSSTTAGCSSSNLAVSAAVTESGTGKKHPGIHFHQLCLVVLESILASNSTISDLMVQYVLAPPPPPEIDIGPSVAAIPLETMKPLGSQILKVLLEGCNKILETGNYATNSVTNTAYRNEIDIVERAANLLSIVFINGSQLGKELCTAITTAHTTAHVSMLSSASGSSAGSHKPLLPMLLSIASRCTRLPGGVGYPVLISMLRMLACIASDCEFAAKQMLEDPANLFVVDLATIASESTGVPPLVQVAACFFLGNCFEALKSNNSNNVSEDSTTLSRKSFLLMIDSRIGLTRFTDLLRKPIASKGSMMNKALIQSYATIFITNKFKEFYHKQVEAIRNGIFEFYTGGNASSDGVSIVVMGDTTQQEIIKMQKEKIEELEHRLITYEIIHTSNSMNIIETTITKADETTAASVNTKALEELNNTLEISNSNLKQELLDLQMKLQQKDDESMKALQQLNISNHTIDNLEEQLQFITKQNNQLNIDYEIVVNNMKTEKETILNLENQLKDLTTHSKENDEMISLSIHNQLQEEYHSIKDLLEHKEEEIIELKQTILNEYEQKKLLKDTNIQKDRKIELLLEELEKISSNEAQISSDNERKMKDLESRNAELTQQLWAVESEIEKTIQQKLSELSLINHNNDNDAIDISPVIDVIDNLVITLQIDVDEDYIKMKEDDENHTCYSITQRISMAESVLQQVSEALSMAIGECSDIAEHAEITDLQGNEGSILRFLDCCRKLRTSLYDSYQSNELVDQYKLEVDIFKTQLDESEKLSRELEQQKNELLMNITELLNIKQYLTDRNHELILNYDSLKNNIKYILLNISNQNELKYNELLAKNNELSLELNQINSSYEAIKNEYTSNISSQQSSNVKDQAQIIELTQQLHQLRSEESHMAHIINTLTYERDQACKETLETKEKQQDLLDTSINNAINHTNDKHKELIITLQYQHQEELKSRMEAFVSEKQQLQDNIKDLEQKNHDLIITIEQIKQQLSDEIVKVKDMNEIEYQLKINQIQEEKEKMIEDHKLSMNEHIWKATQIQISQMQNEIDTIRLTSESLLTHERNNYENQILIHLKDIETLQHELQQERSSLVHMEEGYKVLKIETDQQLDVMNKENSELFNLIEELKMELSNKDIAINTRDEDLVAEQENYASLLIQNEDLSHQVVEITRCLENTSNDLILLKQSHLDEVNRLQGCIDVEKANKVQLQAMYSSPEALQTQNQELKRLTAQNDIISKDLQSKEQQLQTITAQLRRREGEFAGISATIEDLKTEVDQLNIQNEQLNNKLLQDTKTIQEQITSLKALQVELTTKEQEVSSLKKILLAFDSSSNSNSSSTVGYSLSEQVLNTPDRGSSDHINNGGVAANHFYQSTSISNSNIHSGNTTGLNKPGGVSIPSPQLATPTNLMKSSSSNNTDLMRWKQSSHKASLLNQMSPAIKQAALLNAELIKERHKFNSLQDQHSDLLGLLAQQDTELSVFRDTIVHKLGTSELTLAEEHAKRTSIDLYGSYTQFRYDL